MDIGKKFSSLVYPNKNKTAKPRRTILPTGNAAYLPQMWKLDSLYVHSNGNILVNQYIYLHLDTEVTEIDVL